MRIAYFDCFSGVSGDMLLGALVSAGVEPAQFEAALQKLELPGWTLTATQTKRMGITAIEADVRSEQTQPHRSLGDILALIEAAGLPDRVESRAKRIFRRLGEVEASLHGVPIEKVHFHEVGAVDSIVDVVGSLVGFELLGIEKFLSSPLNVGSGSVETAHGRLPVPAPATAELLKGIPTYSSGVSGELVTPTGAAVISTLAEEFGPLPAMRVEAIGYGAGKRELAEQPNLLRLFVGEAMAARLGRTAETVAVIEANIDDMSPQIYGYFVDQALAVGALDVFSIPVQMKKNRPGMLVTVISTPEKVQALTELIFEQTTTIGVRLYEAGRKTLERETVAVETPLGTIRMKLARLDGRLLNAAPEYDDCQRIAQERGLPLKEVIAEANFRFRQQFRGAD